MTGRDRLTAAQDVPAAKQAYPGNGSAGPRYRHPGDAIRLVVSSGTLLVVVVVCWLWTDALLGESAAAFGVGTGSVLGRLLVGIAQVVAVAGLVVAVVVLLVVHRYRLLASLAGAGLVAVGGWIGVVWLLAPAAPASPVADRQAQSWITTSAFPGGAALAAGAAVSVVAGPWMSHAWRRVPWLAIGLVVAAQLVAGVLLPMEIVLALAVGWFVGAAFLVAFGAPDRRIEPAQITEALLAAGLDVTGLRPAAEHGRGARPFAASLSDGGRVFVKVLGQDQRDADLLYRGYRFVRLRGVGDTPPASSLKQSVERQALAALMAERAGVRVPHVQRIVEAADGSVMLVMDLIDGHSLEHHSPDAVTDPQLQALWSQVQLLHDAGIAHRSLRPANVMLDESDQPWIVDFSFAEVAATALQQSVDRAELLASLALVVGPDRAAASASVMGDARLASAVPLLQPLALSAGTRRALRGQGDLLARTRAAVSEASSAPPAKLPNLQRVRPQTLLMIAAAAGAFYFLLPQLAQVGDSWEAFRSISWAWLPVIVLMSFATYVASAVSIMGAVSEPLPFGPTLLTQWASSFVNRVSPANIGGMALNIRFLQKCGVDPASAAAGVGLNSLAGGIVHLSLLVGFFSWTGTELGQAFHLPSASKLLLALAVLAAVLGGVLASRWGRRTILRRLTGGLRAAAGDLRRVARNPGKLTLLFGGSAATTLAYVAAVAASVAAFGGGPSLAQLGTVYLAGSALAAAAPTPGGLGPLEAALVAGLTGVGMAAGPAVSAVLTYRLATYWLPILPGWLSWQFLQRRAYV
jgi:uncharacterized protein (TIRG00374 family)